MVRRRVDQIPIRERNNHDPGENGADNAVPRIGCEKGGLEDNLFLFCFWYDICLSCFKTLLPEFHEKPTLLQSTYFLPVSILALSLGPSEFKNLNK